MLAILLVGYLLLVLLVTHLPAKPTIRALVAFTELGIRTKVLSGDKTLHQRAPDHHTWVFPELTPALFSCCIDCLYPPETSVTKNPPCCHQIGP